MTVSWPNKRAVATKLLKVLATATLHRAGLASDRRHRRGGCDTASIVRLDRSLGAGDRRAISHADRLRPTGSCVAVFFFLHSESQVNSPSVRLAQELGGRDACAIVRGVVVSEPKISERNTASFRLRATSIEIHGVERLGAVTLLARWHGDVAYGDEVQLFGVLTPVEGPRNPGEFDMRAIPRAS